MNGIATHDHGGVLRISQERYSPWIRNGVNPTKLDVDLEANIGKVLGLGTLTLETL